MTIFKIFFSQNKGLGVVNVYMVWCFESAYLNCYFSFKSYEYGKGICWKKYYMNNSQLIEDCKKYPNILYSTLLNHYWISNIEILQSSSSKTMISAKKYLVAKIYLITQKWHNFWTDWPNVMFFLSDFFIFKIVVGQFCSILL